MIAVDHLTKRYGTVAAVDGLGFEVRQPNGLAIARRAVVLAGRCGTGDDRYSRRVSSRGRRGPGWPARTLGRWLALRCSQAPDGRTYQRRRADAPMAAAGLGVLVVCGVLVANRTVLGTDVAVFRRVNHWPGWLYPPMWTVELSGVIGALPLVAAAAALLRRLRLAAATLLKVWLEAVAKMVVQRDRPAETLPDVILRGQYAAHGLSCPSAHAMVIFAITALVAPTSKASERSCLGRWPPRSACHGCTLGRTSPWTSPRGRAWACSSGARRTWYSACPAPAPPAPADNGEMVPCPSTPETSPPAPSPAGSRCVIPAVGTGGIGTETASAAPSGCPAWPTLNP